MIRTFLVLALALTILPAATYAADATPVPATTSPAEAPPPATPPANAEEMDRRVELSKQWHALMPISVKDQVNEAIEQIARQQPANEQEIFRANMRSILNYQAIEKISIDAFAEVYTEQEMKSMIEYYSKPEAQSARKKDQVYMEKVYPQITRMLDQAAMRARTGGTGQ